MTFIEFFHKYSDFKLSPQQEKLLKNLEGKDKSAIHDLPNDYLKTALFIADAIRLCFERDKSVIATLTKNQAQEIVRQIGKFKVRELVDAKISKFKKFWMVYLTKKEKESASEEDKTL